MNYPPSLTVESEGLPTPRAVRAEVIAARALEKLLTARSKRRDLLGGESGLHDFDMIMHDGTLVAVE
ncbi:MAG: hypothetical protein M3O70_18185 [Actinomycetota bacterium]|nr:hypothetical protein [Actinomycetota bacterium]